MHGRSGQFLLVVLPLTEEGGSGLPPPLLVMAECGGGVAHLVLPWFEEGSGRVGLLLLVDERRGRDNTEGGDGGLAPLLVVREEGGRGSGVRLPLPLEEGAAASACCCC